MIGHGSARGTGIVGEGWLGRQALDQEDKIVRFLQVYSHARTDVGFERSHIIPCHVHPPGIHAEQRRRDEIHALAGSDYLEALGEQSPGVARKDTEIPHDNAGQVRRRVGDAPKRQSEVENEMEVVLDAADGLKEDPAVPPGGGTDMAAIQSYQCRANMPADGVRYRAPSTAWTSPPLQGQLQCLHEDE